MATKSKSKAAGRGAKSKATAARRTPSSRKGSQTTSDHGQIRQWAEARGAVPACVRGTGGRGDTGMIRLDFPNGPEPSLQQISWDEWFEKFDENNLALVYQETTAKGAKSNFNKLVSRQTATGAKTRSAGKS